MANRRKESIIFTALADLSRVPIVRLERVDRLCSYLQKSTLKVHLRKETFPENSECESNENPPSKQESSFTTKQMFPENHNKDTLTLEPPKKQYKLQKHSDQTSNEKLLNKSNILPEISKEAMCDKISPPMEKFSMKDSNSSTNNQPQTYSGSNSCDVFIRSNQKETTSTSWENTRTALNSLHYSGNTVSGVQVPEYSGNTAPRHSMSMDQNRFPYSGHNGPGMSAPTDNSFKLNPSAYNDVSRSMSNPISYSRNTALNPQTFQGNNNSDVNLITYPSNSPNLNSPSYSGSNMHSLTYSGYNMSTGSNVPVINSQTYATNRTGMNPNYSSSSAHVMNSSVYSGNGRSTALPSVYYGNNMSSMPLQAYSENSSTAVNSSVYSGNSGQTYSGNNSLAFSVSSGAQNYPTNSGMSMNVMDYINTSRGVKLITGDYCGNKDSKLNAHTYSVNSTSGYSASGVRSTMTYSGNSAAAATTTSSQTCSSFPANLIAQQYEVLQNYCDNSTPAINSADCQDSTWSNDYVTLNNLSTNGYQLDNCSLDFSNYMFSCQVCGSMLVLANDMIKHWRIHNGVDSLTCTACYVSFTDVLFLQAHWKAIHMGGICTDPGVILRPDDKVISELVCEVCGFIFSQFNSLEQHMFTAHINIQQWKYVASTQHNHKALQNIPGTNDHSMTNSTVLENNSVGTRQDTSIMEHQNILDESMMENKMDNIVESDVVLLEPKVKIEIFENSDDKSDNSSDVSGSSNEQDKPFKCRVCDISSSSLEELLEHWKIHIGADTMTCSMCKKTFTDLPFLQAHWRRSHMNAFQISSLVTRNSLLPDDSSSLPCDACGYAFPDFSELEQHMISSHVFSGPPQVPLRTREFCRQYTETSGDVKRGICDRTEVKKSDEINISKREEIRRKVNSSNFVKKTVSSDGCLVCGEIPNDMIKHLLTHTGLSSLECCLCGKDFVDVPFLQAHWRATHMNGEVRHTNHGIYVGNYKENVSYTGKFLCETCGCYVPQFSALEKHIVLTHTIIEPPYICKCGHRFSSEEELKRHISTCSW
ncbi:hypothetical protein L9F63_013629 [Diploptera punctata]|uniref:C2H2-type domain-containing protein n=1 Tax=Diploptera punctata TaxID=6984 RepID=A0AAD8EM96_DIPPU|nr:hypothetical protein L9F63_013629 [Diploptera punctata]